MPKRTPNVRRLPLPAKVVYQFFGAGAIEQRHQLLVEADGQEVLSGVGEQRHALTFHQQGAVLLFQPWFLEHQRDSQPRLRAALLVRGAARAAGVSRSEFGP
jgi:hypothetical protein